MDGLYSCSSLYSGAIFFLNKAMRFENEDISVNIPNEAGVVQDDRRQKPGEPVRRCIQTHPCYV